MYQRITDWLQIHPLQISSKHITESEDAIQIDLVPELPQSGGDENILTGMVVFFRYSFACPSSSKHAKTVAKAILHIMTKRAYLPTKIISDKGSLLVSQVVREVVEVLRITLQHATTKHSQTIGMFE